LSEPSTRKDRTSDESPETARKPARRGSHVGGDLLLIFGAFVLASALAGALGAANLGTALSFGQIAFALAVVYVMLRR
jgi:hypothetical protein